MHLLKERGFRDLVMFVGGTCRLMGSLYIIVFPSQSQYIFETIWDYSAPYFLLASFMFFS